MPQTLRRKQLSRAKRYPEQVRWSVNWSEPDEDGHIDYLDDDKSGCLYATREEALQAVRTDDMIKKWSRHPYLVKVTFEREDP